MKKNKMVSPVLKWVGGKRQLLPEIDKYIPTDYNTYFEPFVGGGAVLFHLQPEKAVIGDMNEELINLYQVVKSNPNELIDELSKYRNDSVSFYNARALDRCSEYRNLSNIKKAARIHYLNKTCYNGLFRVNSSGEFNTPFANYKSPNITNKNCIKAVSNYFNEAKIRFLCSDFKNVLSSVKKNDFVYLDPPYDPVSDSSSFTGYTKGGFDREEQKRLKRECDKLDKKGAKFLLSNSDTQFIRELYKGYKIEFVNAKRSINSVGEKRGKIPEVLIRNFE